MNGTHKLEEIEIVGGAKDGALFSVGGLALGGDFYASVGSVVMLLGGKFRVVEVNGTRAAVEPIPALSDEAMAKAKAEITIAFAERIANLDKEYRAAQAKIRQDTRKALILVVALTAAATVSFLIAKL